MSPSELRDERKMNNDLTSQTPSLTPGDIIHLECRVVDRPDAPERGMAALMFQLIQETKTMSDATATLNAKIDSLIAAQKDATARVSARDALLTSAVEGRDTAVASLASMQEQMTALKAQAEALPTDTAAHEAAIAAATDKLDGVIAGLNAMELAPPLSSPPIGVVETPAAPDAPAPLAGVGVTETPPALDPAPQAADAASQATAATPAPGEPGATPAV